MGWTARVGLRGQQAGTVAAAAAKLHQSCPTLWDPTDGGPPGSPVPGILQARTLEWVAISFSNTGFSHSLFKYLLRRVGLLGVVEGGGGQINSPKKQLQSWKKWMRTTILAP